MVAHEHAEMDKKTCMHGNITTHKACNTFVSIFIILSDRQVKVMLKANFEQLMSDRNCNDSGLLLWVPCDTRHSAVGAWARTR